MLLFSYHNDVFQAIAQLSLTKFEVQLTSLHQLNIALGHGAPPCSLLDV